MSEPQTSAPLAPDVLRALVEGCAGRVGEEFFHSLVRNVSAALGTKGAWVTEWLPEARRLRALAFWYAGAPFGPYEYRVAGTPCEGVIERRALVHVPDRLVELYPEDPDLPGMDAVSYMGVPLADADGRLLGHLAVLHDRPMPESGAAEAVFRVFAERAEAELRRLVRDRALREREERLARLVASAMDAIVELDGELFVRALNPAAERTFGVRAEDARGKLIERLLSASSCALLRERLPGLAALPEGERCLWLPQGDGGLAGLAAGGRTFPAEATLSGFELDGRAFYTLILRDVDERARAEERIRALTSETALLREELDALQGFHEIVGTSPALRAMLRDLERVAPSEATVLITGETGTGKELVARAIHARSRRAARPLVKVNCAAIAPGLEESELFGHVKGAFTGATQGREGRFALADGGTLFLDEVGELPRDLQAKLLRVLQEGEFEPVGSSRTLKVDVRVIAATNRDLERMVAEGSFRSDLYYRLNVFPVRLPPLRERGEDVLLLAERFAARLSRRDGRALRLTEAGRARLLRYEWPGNVRELENVIERAHLTTADGRTLNLERALPASDPRAGTAGPVPAPDDARILTADELLALERANLRRALEAAGWKVAGAGGAAERLGLRPSTLASRMRALGVERPRPARES